MTTIYSKSAELHLPGTAVWWGPGEYPWHCLQTNCRGAILRWNRSVDGCVYGYTVSKGFPYWPFLFVFLRTNLKGQAGRREHFHMNVVHKYGGSSVATIEKIKAVAQRVAEVKRSGSNIAVVASAMGKTTNELIALASQLGEDLPPREMDSLLSTGEQKTVTLLAMALSALGVPAVSLTGFQGGFVTNQNFRHAKIKDIRIEAVQKYIDAGYVPVLAGFQGIDEEGNITTLGRGGSDTTAVALAAKLGWDCEIYTDVDGVYTVDPRRCPGAKKLTTVTSDEMMEMASLGAGVLETRSVELAKKYGVRLYLGQSLEPDHTKGTYIMDQMNFEEMPVTGISIREDCCMVTARGLQAGGAPVNALFSVIAALDINVDMISQQMGADGSCILTFSCSEEAAKTLLEQAPQRGFASPLELQPGLCKLSLVGAGMVTHSGIAGKAFAVLQEANVPYYQITTSEISISLTIDAQNAERAIAALAAAFDLCEEEEA